MAGNSEFNLDILLSHKFPETTYTYSERDVVLYALGVGACGRDVVDADELKYVYHEGGQHFVQVLPTFAALFSLASMPNGFELPGLHFFLPFLVRGGKTNGQSWFFIATKFDPRLLLHGQQYIELYKSFPSSGCIHNKVSLAALHDKGKAAIVEYERRSYEKESGELLCTNRATIFLRGAGGFSKSSEPYSYTNYTTDKYSVVEIPKSQPFAVFEDCTQPSQALLHRLSGDHNPLHSDPMVAKNCSVVRAIIKCICRGDPTLVKSISGRFLLHVYPGETLITEMWLEGLRIIYQMKVKERNRNVLSGHVDVHRLPPAL